MSKTKTETINTEPMETVKNSMTIPVIQEDIVVDKEIVETGKIKISKNISEHQQTIDMPLMQEKVSVERVAINKFVDTPPEIRHDGDTMIIPVLEEQIVIQKRLVLVEELHVRKQVVEINHTETVVARKENVNIERIE
ncbi:MAG: YsnF/AvaK domain-containing protein [Aridibacter sp.]